MKTHSLTAVTAGLTLILIAAAGEPAFATNYLVKGTKLVAQSKGDRGKLVWVSRDRSVSLPNSNLSVFGATLYVKSANAASSVQLEPEHWTYSGHTVRYRNPDPDPSFPCRLAMIGNLRRIRVVCTEDLITTADGQPEQFVAIELKTHLDRYCATFGGVTADNDGYFSAEKAPAPIACDAAPPTTTTTNSTVTTQTLPPPTDCATTTTIAVCGDEPGCGGACPGNIECQSDGGGGCVCPGTPVPCSQAGHPMLCQYGECPPGQQCGSLYNPPDCILGCGCQ